MNKRYTEILQKPKIGAHSIYKIDISQILYKLFVTTQTNLMFYFEF